MNNLLTTILTNTYTQSDLNHRLGLLKGFLEFWYYQPHEKTNFLFLLNEFFTRGEESRDEFNALNFWGPNFYGEFSKENLYQLLNQIKKEAEALPTVTIFLPFVPPIYEIPKLGEWFRQNVSLAAVIDVKSDPRLIGGCALARRGVYQDFSLRYYIEKNRPAVLKVIADYVSTGGIQMVES